MAAHYRPLATGRRLLLNADNSPFAADRLLLTADCWPRTTDHDPLHASAEAMACRNDRARAPGLRHPLPHHVLRRAVHLRRGAFVLLRRRRALRSGGVHRAHADGDLRDVPHRHQRARGLHGRCEASGSAPVIVGHHRASSTSLSSVVVADGHADVGVRAMRAESLRCEAPHGPGNLEETHYSKLCGITQVCECV